MLTWYNLGGTNYKGNIIFAGEGQGESVPSALYLMNPVEPYNTTRELSPAKLHLPKAVRKLA